MVYFVAKAVEERRQAGGGRWVTGDQLVQSDGGFDFQGFNQVRDVLSWEFRPGAVAPNDMPPRVMGSIKPLARDKVNRPLMVDFCLQVLFGGKEGRGLQARYVVLDCDGDRLVPTHTLTPTHTYGSVGNLKPLGRTFIFPGGKPPSASFCWFSPEEACTGGVFRDTQRVGTFRTLR